MVFADPSFPNPELTPGKTNPNLTKDVICSPNFRTGNYRDVTDAKRKRVFERYGIDFTRKKEFETDHLRPVETGGSNDIENLWPEPWREARLKDKLENLAHKCICMNFTKFSEVERRFSENWYQFYLDTKKAAVCP